MILRWVHQMQICQDPAEPHSGLECEGEQNATISWTLGLKSLPVSTTTFSSKHSSIPRLLMRTNIRYPELGRFHRQTHPYIIPYCRPHPAAQIVTAISAKNPKRRESEDITTRLHKCRRMNHSGLQKLYD